MLFYLLLIFFSIVISKVKKSDFKLPHDRLHSLIEPISISTNTSTTHFSIIKNINNSPLQACCRKCGQSLTHGDKAENPTSATKDKQEFNLNVSSVVTERKLWVSPPPQPWIYTATVLTVRKLTNHIRQAQVVEREWGRRSGKKTGERKKTVGEFYG